MTFSLMLWMPSGGSMINGLVTVGAWDELRRRPGAAHVGGGARLLRHGEPSRGT